ncbi:hypothetical protein [Oceanobacillus sp. Castelsardo]|uniref:hypothetical protein n=1 Tax=Oceanobacillus sp. Castelsardo TaxID=1851204 RepID=UPI0012E79C7B|nr:hypothetical protein [Oceanobacillus sp. Castelsardo]
MNNRSMMTSLLTIGAAGAAIYGIGKGMQNGSLQKIPQQVSNMVQNTLSNPNVQQVTEQFQSMISSQSNNQSSPNGNEMSGN